MFCVKLMFYLTSANVHLFSYPNKIFYYFLIMFALLHSNIPQALMLKVTGFNEVLDARLDILLALHKSHVGHGIQ